MSRLNIWAINIFCILATLMILTGGLFRPIGFMTIWNDRLAAPYWEVYLLVGAVTGIVAALVTRQFKILSPFTPAVFGVVTLIFGTFAASIYVEAQRTQFINAFMPDVELRNSFFRSLRNAPQEHQFYLHGAALKDCTPYAWSYRTMSFYELPANVAVNVLPSEWVETCQTARDGRN